MRKEESDSGWNFEKVHLKDGMNESKQKDRMGDEERKERRRGVN